MMKDKVQSLVFDVANMRFAPSLVEQVVPAFRPAGNQPRIVSWFKGIGHGSLMCYRTTHQDSGFMGARDWVDARLAEAAA